jgi:hypothetical protein
VFDLASSCRTNFTASSPVFERQHRILVPLLQQILKDLEAGGLEGAASTLAIDKLILNGAGEFVVGGQEGDNGLSGKELVIDHYGLGVPADLPPEEWFSIKTIVRDLELIERDWAADLLAGYFCQPVAPWSGERIVSSQVATLLVKKSVDIVERNAS